MSLRDAFPARTIDTSSHDIVGDLFVPMLQNATRYDRGVGYFSSGWLRVNAQGMAKFAGNGGRARWITSPKLSESDWTHLRKGERARRNRVLRNVLSRRIDDLERSLKNNTLSALGWTVADGIPAPSLSALFFLASPLQFHQG